MNVQIVRIFDPKHFQNVYIVYNNKEELYRSYYQDEAISYCCDNDYDYTEITE